MTTQRMSAAEARKLLEPKKQNKYGNKHVVVDGIRFDSAAEAARWCTLLLLQKAGEIRSLTRQVRYELHTPDGKRIGLIVPDFEYIACSTGELITEDVKSPATAKTRAFQHKKRHFEAEYRRKLRVVLS